MTDTTFVYSTFANDPDLGELSDLFAAEMPTRIEFVEQLVAAAKHDELLRFAHQLKGSAGSYGFVQITPSAGRLEQALRDHRPETEVAAAIDDLLGLMRRVRGGAPSEAPVVVR